MNRKKNVSENRILKGDRTQPVKQHRTGQLVQMNVQKPEENIQTSMPDLRMLVRA
jgi:hypothetical protein